MSSEIVATSQDGNYRVRLVRQTDSTNPREDYGPDVYLTNVITVSTRDFDLIDRDGGPLQSAWDYYNERHGTRQAVKLFTRHASICYGVKIFDRQPHDGARALWYLMPNRAVETPWPAEKVIETEAEEHETWARGEVYGYEIEERVIWGRRDGKEGSMTTWEHVDSSWGYVGYGYAKSEARTRFTEYTKGN